MAWERVSTMLQPLPTFHKRAAPFGLEGAQVDGSDVEAVAEVAGDLISDARSGKPGFLVVDCYRFYGHARMDKSPYRDDTEEAHGRLRDPVVKARQTLICAMKWMMNPLMNWISRLRRKWMPRSILPQMRATPARQHF